MYYLYIVRCSDNSLYCGQTNDLERRVREHNVDKRKSAKYLRGKTPVTLVYSETYSTLQGAMKRELEIKKWPKAKKETLIKGDLRKFLSVAKTRGYAAGESTTYEEKDRSKSTRYSQGNFSFHDNWFGGEPFGGREVVWKEGRPHWIMIYYGSDSGKAQNLITFLLKCLSKIPKEMPVRGPKELTEGDFKYVNHWNGSIERFNGEEKILYKGEEVFSTKYMGGLVDQ